MVMDHPCIISSAVSVHGAASSLLGGVGIGWVGVKSTARLIGSAVGQVS